MFSPGISELLIITIVFVTVFGAPVLMLYLIIRAFRGDRSKRSAKTEADETRLIQEIHHGLARMENRIEALETLLMDRAQHRTYDKKREFE